jgi:hypothetical protein
MHLQVSGWQFTNPLLPARVVRQFSWPLWLFWMPMSPRISILVLMMVALLSLGACTAVKPAKYSPDPDLTQLVEGLDKCLASQSATVLQLQNQGEQLAVQYQQLASLSRQLDADAVPETAKSPAVVDCPNPEHTSGKQLVGYMEQVWLSELQLALTARLDTGAETASLDATNIERFERDGKPWVRFDILHPESGEPLRMERRVKRTLGIAQPGTTKKERRPVVKLDITIGHINQMAEFALSDRTHPGYQLSIGRNILQAIMVVDVSEKNIAPFVLPDTSGDRTGDAQ